jgi:hypothetical protein
MCFLCVHTFGENFSGCGELKRLHNVKSINDKTGLLTQQICRVTRQQEQAF